jgi:adenosine deaminase
MRKKILPVDTCLEAIKKKLVVAEHCPDLPTYLQKFELPLQMMQDEETLQRIAYELLADAHAEHVKYLEIRFAPILHTRQGLSMQAVIASVLQGMADAKKDFGISSHLILCQLRHHAVDSTAALLRAGEAFLGKGVVAVDLAGAEPLGFAPVYTPFFKQAKAMGYRITIHAGETGHSQNVIDAIELLGAERIGHAVAIQHDTHAINLVREKGVFLETCPTSNLQTKAVASYQAHPLGYFLRQDLPLSINTDNRTVSQVNMSQEIQYVSEAQLLSAQDYQRIYQQSVVAAFCEPSLKKKLLNYLGGL